ncbi:hypothetical protein VQ044_20345 [Aurantimonas sp. C2-5-R2]|uniref:hypothetical protein n=1 Tax=Aurantimonas sp. C2-5-R2 TaxID=3113713 RepID=UPI002F93659A
MTVAFESGPRARRAYAREDGWDYPEDLNPEFLLQFYEHWGELDEGIKSLQEKKKSMIASVRSWYGRRQAEGVKKEAYPVVPGATISSNCPVSDA